MKSLVSLDKISNNTAYVTDIQSENHYQIPLSADEEEIYSDYLREADNYEAPNEETGVLLIFNKETKQFDSVNNESELF